MLWCKSKYVLPNLLTLFNLLCGFYSIQMTVMATTARDLSVAGWLIGLAMICDLFDGRVARVTGGQSKFGSQFDSFADAISFGVAPAILLYRWGLAPLGHMGILLAFGYTACAIGRLARFNIRSRQTPGDEKTGHFKGLPTPMAAGTVISVSMASMALTQQPETGAHWRVAGLTVLVSGLMVSNVKYRTFKELDLDQSTLPAVVGLLVLFGVISYRVGPIIAVMLGMMVYVVTGLGARLMTLSRLFWFNTRDADTGHYAVGSRDDED